MIGEERREREEWDEQEDGIPWISIQLFDNSVHF